MFTFSTLDFMVGLEIMVHIKHKIQLWGDYFLTPIKKLLTILTSSSSRT